MLYAYSSTNTRHEPLTPLVDNKLTFQRSSLRKSAGLLFIDGVLVGVTLTVVMTGQGPLNAYIWDISVKMTSTKGHQYALRFGTAPGAHRVRSGSNYKEVTASAACPTHFEIGEPTDSSSSCDWSLARETSGKVNL